MRASAREGAKYSLPSFQALPSSLHLISVGSRCYGCVCLVPYNCPTAKPTAPPRPISHPPLLLLQPACLLCLPPGHFQHHHSDLPCPLTFCNVPVLFYLLLSQEEHVLLCWPTQVDWLARRWIFLGKQREITFDLSQMPEINKLFQLFTDDTESVLCNRDTIFL